MILARSLIQGIYFVFRETFFFLKIHLHQMSRPHLVPEMYCELVSLNTERYVATVDELE